MENVQSVPEHDALFLLRNYRSRDGITCRISVLHPIYHDLPAFVWTKTRQGHHREPQVWLLFGFFLFLYFFRFSGLVVNFFVLAQILHPDWKLVVFSRVCYFDFLLFYLLVY